MNDVIKGIPISKGNLKKITIYSDRLEVNDFLVPKKVVSLNEIASWSEVKVVQNPGNIQYLRLTIYTKKKKYRILSLHWQNYTQLRDILIQGKDQTEEVPEKVWRTVIIFMGVIALLISVAFFIDYLQTQSLLKNGTKAKAQITGRYYEISNNRDTSAYSFRMTVVPDTTNGQQIYKIPERLQAFVKQITFHKYSEGSIVNVVYNKDDEDHAKLVEEIE